MCPGKNLALTEVAYTIVKILQSFRTIENRDPVLEFFESIRLSPTAGMVPKSRWYQLDHVMKSRSHQHALVSPVGLVVSRAQ